MTDNLDSKKVMLTCYDASFARIMALSQAVDYVLVGDSLGMVVYGYENTQSVSLDMMVDHTSAVWRGIKQAKTAKSPTIIADLPFNTYNSPEQAVESAIRLRDAGADMVKFEGALPEIVTAIDSEGIRVCCHLGLLPQTQLEYKLQANSDDEASALLRAAHEVEVAGAHLLVLEMIPAPLAKKVTQELSIRTIGIGAGPDCGGQVLVSYDVFGMNMNFSPKFLKRYAYLESSLMESIKKFSNDVRSGEFPNKEQSFQGSLAKASE